MKAGVQVHLGTKVETIGGVVGNFQAQLTNGERLEVGGIVVATGANPYLPDEFNYGSNVKVVTNLELEKLLASGEIESKRITFISCVGSPGSKGCSRYCCAWP